MRPKQTFTVTGGNVVHIRLLPCYQRQGQIKKFVIAFHPLNFAQPHVAPILTTSNFMQGCGDDEQTTTSLVPGQGRVRSLP